LPIHSVAVIAQPIATSAGAAFVLRNVTAGRTCTVIVMHAIERWLRSLIDGVEYWRRGHGTHLLSFCHHDADDQRHAICCPEHYGTSLFSGVTKPSRDAVRV
jgi:hypothetical protein